MRLLQYCQTSTTVTIIPRRDSPNGSDDPVSPDYVVALTSLPHLLGLELSDLVRRDEIHGTRANRYRGRSERLAALPGLKVGIAWAEDRSFWRCQTIRPSRRAGYGAAKRQGLRALVAGRLAGRRLPHSSPARVRCDAVHQGLCGYPPAITQLDFVVTVHATVAVWLAEWASRYGLCCRACAQLALANGREDSPRYPTLRLFRQAVSAWASALTRLAKALRLIGTVEHNNRKREALSDPVDRASTARYGFRYGPCRIVLPASSSR